MNLPDLGAQCLSAPTLFSREGLRAHVPPLEIHVCTSAFRFEMVFYGHDEQLDL
jgi:hypothetical protein